MTTKNNFKNSLIVAFAIIVLVALALAAITNPVWESNDDPVMSMIAHGYGLMKIGSPNIIFSNVLWGHLIRAVPEINGVLGYDIVYYATLTLSGFFILVGLFFLSESAILSIPIFILLMLKPIINPQFTMLSGYAALAGFSCLLMYSKTESKRILIACSSLFVFSFLIRSELFVLFTIAALPLIPWTKLKKPFALSIIIITGCFLTFATLYNWQSYQKAEWEHFNAFQKIRPAYTDFGLGKFSTNSPEVLKKYNFSVNDISLVSNWFYGDSSLIDFANLKNLAQELKQHVPLGDRLRNAKLGILHLTHPELWAIMCIAGVLFLLHRRNKTVWIGWILCVSLLMSIGWIGRPGIMRLYHPLCALLTFYTFVILDIGKSQKKLKVLILSTVVSINVIYLFNYLNKRELMQFSTLNWNSHVPILVIGSAIPFEDVYHPFSTDRNLRSLNLFSSSWATLIPGSISMESIKTGNNISDLLRKNKDVFIIENKKMTFLPDEPSLDIMLNLFCKEHFHKSLVFTPAGNIGNFKILKWQCNSI